MEESLEKVQFIRALYYTLEITLHCTRKPQGQCGSHNLERTAAVAIATKGSHSVGVVALRGTQKLSTSSLGRRELGDERF